jgi:hypothetical protein
MSTRTAEPVELQISSEKLAYIIAKAREFDVKVAAGEPHSGSNPSDDGESEILEDFRDDATADELRDAIDQLSEDEVTDLVAIVWVGREDFDRTSWDEARTLAAERRRSRSSRYLMGIPNLPDYLENGLSELGHSIDE